MFDPKALTRLLDLHDRAYRLFLWVNGSLRRGHRPYAEVDEALTVPDAARTWLGKNRETLPREFRPATDEAEEFSRLFISYLSTSFEIVDGREVGICGGCFCCGVLKLPRHLRARNPDRKARETADELKLVYLRNLSEELELPLREAELKKFVAESKGDLAMVTWTRELFRRSRFASQGEGVLALWREFARTRPRSKFRLEARKILAAEAVLVERLRKWAGGL